MKRHERYNLIEQNRFRESPFRQAELSNWEPAGDDEGKSPDLATKYLQTSLRHRGLITTVAIVCATLGVLSNLTTQPVYRTRTSLDIQSVNSDFMNLQSVVPNAATPTDTLVQTQVKLLESDSLLDRVEMKLAAEPHPEFIERNDLLSRMRRVMHLGGGSRLAYADLVHETAASLKVKPMGITQLVEVTCDSWDPAFSAAFCNTLTDQFREVDQEGRGDEAKRTSDWLVRQAADVRQKAEQSQQRLIAATGGNGLILNDQGTAVGEDGLRSMQAELVRAQAARMEAEAQLVTRKSLSNTGPIENGSPVYAANKLKLAELETQLAALVPPLTEENPRVIHLRSEIRQVQLNLSKETLEGDQKLQNEYDAAKHHEALLTATYHALEGNVSSDLQKSSGIDLLRREVQSEQQLYQTLLQRAKEAGFASAMPASTIRVVDLAKTPLQATSPRPLNSAMIGLLVGVVLGLVVAIFKDRRTSLLRMPGDSERLLSIHELGVIPSPFALKASAAETPGLVARTVRALSSGSSRTVHTAPWEDQFSLEAEAYRNTTMSLLDVAHKTLLRSYVISSPSAGEGKTTITCNIGVALSKIKLRVLLIDGDLRKPSLHKAFAVPNEIGLRQVLAGEDLEVDSFCHATAYSNLYVVPAGAGSTNTVELLHADELRLLMEHVAKDFDVVLIDTPPMLHMADARILARQVEGTILVVRSGVTSHEDAMTARRMLARDNTVLVGSILNDFNPRASGKNDYYSSYSSYRKSSEQEQAGVSR